MFCCAHSGGAVSMHGTVMETNDLCRHLVDKRHRPAHLLKIFKDVRSALQSKKDTRFVALCT